MIKLILILLGGLFLLTLVNNGNPIGSLQQNIPLIKCQDYNYQIEFQEEELPVEINFYIIDDEKEEFFKKEIANEKFESTLLHCGHDYKVVYTFKGYEPFVDFISIPEVNPLIQKTTKISVNQNG